MKTRLATVDFGVRTASLRQLAVSANAIFGGVRLTRFRDRQRRRAGRVGRRFRELEGACAMGRLRREITAGKPLHAELGGRYIRAQLEICAQSS